MAGEFDPLLEMGFIPDRYAICGCKGVITKGDDLRKLCEHFIDNGSHFYDVMDRYDRIISYILNRKESSAGNVTKWIIPFLKAYGVTDHQIRTFSTENIELMPGAKETFRYITSVLPLYICTEMTDHMMMEVSDRIECPLCEITSTEFSLDQTIYGRAESRKLRSLAEEINALKIPEGFYELNVPTELKDEDIKILSTIDDILNEKILDTPALNLMETSSIMTSHRKAYRMLDIRREMGIDLDSTMYIGSNDTDFQSLDLVSDGEGVAISMNGEEYAVRGSNVAIMSEDTTVLTVFASMFAGKGTESCMDLANNWSKEYLKTVDLPDGTLIESLLRKNKLAEVHLVDKKNCNDVAEKSVEFRKKLLKRK